MRVPEVAAHRFQGSFYNRPEDRRNLGVGNAFRNLFLDNIPFPKGSFKITLGRTETQKFEKNKPLIAEAMAWGGCCPGICHSMHIEAS